MLADNRSKALVDNFAWQWLQLSKLRGAVPDPALFSDFDENLRGAAARDQGERRKPDPRGSQRGRLVNGELYDFSMSG